MKPIEGALHQSEENTLIKTDMHRQERQLSAYRRSGNEAAQGEISCPICRRMDSGFIWANDGEERWSCGQCPA